VYSAIVSHSGYYAPDQNRYTGDLFHHDRALRLANTPADYLGKVPVPRPLGVYLDVGATDRQSRAESAAVSAILVHRGLAVTFHVFPGEQHTWATWRRNLHSSLPWLSAWFASQAAVPLAP
jgi:S-formylglutathione hydrolase FrmB